MTGYGLRDMEARNFSGLLACFCKYHYIFPVKIPFILTISSFYATKKPAKSDRLLILCHPCPLTPDYCSLLTDH
jgi:hypothetical protein